MNSKILPQIRDSIKNRKLCKWTVKKTVLLIGFLAVASVIGCTLALYYSLKKLRHDGSTTMFQKCSKEEEKYDYAGPSYLGKYRRAAIAVDSVPCATVGKKILLENGSAVDAAIATSLCNGLFNPQSMGIGGGHFMLIYLKEKHTVIGIDAREVAPINSKEDMFVNQTHLALYGGLASGVPGEIAGYWAAHKIAGKLPWKRLFEESIDYARNGIRVSPVLAEGIEYYEKQIRKNKILTEIFINNVTGEIYKKSDSIKMTKLANTLTIISEKGSEAFYNGELSESIVRENNDNGGILTIDDLKRFNVSIRPILNVSLSSNYRYYGMPPPSGGLLVSFILNVMSQYRLTPDIYDNPQKLATFYHRLTEVFKHAFAKRSHLGDMSFVNVDDIIKNLTDSEYVKNIKNKIDDDKTFPESYYEPLWLDRSGNQTAHLAVVSQNGDAVSLTSSLNTYFGAKYGGDTTGIIYNNQMDDFSTPGLVNYFGVRSSETNFIKPGKRPMSSMSPSIIVDESNNVRLVIGAAGGTKIITGIATVALKNLWLGRNIKEAIDDSRLHHQLSPPYLRTESDFPTDIESILKEKGHVIKCLEYGSSIVQGIERRPNGYLWANSDVRKGGKTDGF